MLNYQTHRSVKPPVSQPLLPEGVTIYPSEEWKARQKSEYRADITICATELKEFAEAVLTLSQKMVLTGQHEVAISVLKDADQLETRLFSAINSFHKAHIIMKKRVEDLIRTL